MNNPEIKSQNLPCPFCGGTELIEYQAGMRPANVSCWNCEAKGPYAESLALALERWNKRVLGRSEFTPGENTMSWEAFRARCEQRIKLIEDTKDEGVYAKQYAADVKTLLAMIVFMPDTNESDTSQGLHSAEEAYDRILKPE